MIESVSESLGSRRTVGEAQRYGEVDDERSNKLIGRSESKKGFAGNMKQRRRRVSEARKKKGFGRS